jgi:hypothetical protein
VRAGPHGAPVRHWSWGEVGTLSDAGAALGPDGVISRILDVTAGGRTHRFLGPGDALSVFLREAAEFRELPVAPRAVTPADPRAPGLLGFAERAVGVFDDALMWTWRATRRAAATATLPEGVVAFTRLTGQWLLALGAFLRIACGVAGGVVLRGARRTQRCLAPVLRFLGSTPLGAFGRRAAGAFSDKLDVASRALSRHTQGAKRALGFSPSPKHGARLHRRVGGVLAALSVVAVLGGGAELASVSGTTFVASATPVHSLPETLSPQPPGQLAETFEKLAAPLPAATSAPVAAPPSLAGAPALASHEVFGFAPYWTLPDSGSFDVADLTTLAYFSVDINGDGTPNESGPGWEGYESQDLVNLISRAHQAGDRVVLTVTCFSQSSLDQLTSSSAAATQLDSTLLSLVAAKNFDGVNLDFEGQGSADQTGLDTLVSGVSSALSGANSHWQLTMDTYASSAGDPDGFYNIAGLARSVDAFFVMAYDMDNPSAPSPTAPLSGAGFSDADALEQYTAVVPASKVILGVPYYGYDWPTTGPGMGAAATGPPTPLSYSQVLANGGPTYWDPTTQTAWTSYQVNGVWHQTWFDDPTSLALKATAANVAHIRGLGVWALGMDGNNPAMLAALLGHAPVVKDTNLGPVAPTTTTTTSTTTTTTVPSPGTTTTAPVVGPSAYTTTGTWQGKTVVLTPTQASGIPAGLVPVGTLSGFATNDSADSCLVYGPSLVVSSSPTIPGLYVVSATTPTDCVSGFWEFDTASLAPVGGGSGSGGGTTTTVTTVPAATTTTESSPGSK